MYKSASILLATVASLLAGASAMAADGSMSSNAPETYLGFNLAAQTKYDLSCLAGSPCDRKAGSSGKIYGGYMAAPSLFEGVSLSQGVELMYYKAGRAAAGFQTADGAKAGSGDTQGLATSYVLQANFNDFSLNGRAGIAYGHSRVDFAQGGSSSDKSFFIPVVGLGARYQLSKNLSLNADYDRLPERFTDKEKGSVNMFSLGIGYKF